MSQQHKLNLRYLFDAVRIYRILPGALRRGFWYIFSLQTITAFLESSTVVMISFFMVSVGSPETGKRNPVVQAVAPYLPDYWLERLQGDKTFVTAMCLVLLLFIVVKNLSTGFTISRTTLFSERLGVFISREAYRRYFCKSYRWHLSPESSDLLNRLGNRTHLTAMATAILQFFGYFVCCLFMFFALFYYEPVLTITLLGAFAVVSYLTYAGVRRRVDNAGTRLNEMTIRENWAVNMANRGIREIIAYRKQEVFLDNIVKTVEDEVPYKSFLAFAGMLPAWFLEVAGFATIFGVMVTMAYVGRTLPEIIGAVSMLFWPRGGFCRPSAAPWG